MSLDPQKIKRNENLTHGNSSTMSSNLSDEKNPRCLTHKNYMQKNLPPEIFLSQKFSLFGIIKVHIKVPAKCNILHERCDEP